MGPKNGEVVQQTLPRATEAGGRGGHVIFG